MLGGFSSRIENELKYLYFKKNNNIKNKYIRIPIEIIDSHSRNISSFLGGASLSNIYNSSEYEDYWISWFEWNEIGPNIIDKKCYDFSYNKN